MQLSSKPPPVTTGVRVVFIGGRLEHSRARRLGLTEQLREQGNEPTRWHWAYGGTCFRLSQRGETAGARPVILSRGFVMTRGGVDALREQLRAEAMRLGLGRRTCWSWPTGRSGSGIWWAIGLRRRASGWIWPRQSAPVGGGTGVAPRRRKGSAGVGGAGAGQASQRCERGGHRGLDGLGVAAGSDWTTRQGHGAARRWAAGPWNRRVGNIGVGSNGREQYWSTTGELFSVFPIDGNWGVV